jgi:23S rRNA (uracil1939-C5)-methyltransferase
MKKGEIVELRITDFAFGGKGIAKVQTEQGEFVVFVANSFPGQLVEAKLEKKRKNYGEAKLLQVLERSSEEVMNEFQEISGGPYIYVPIEKQEEYKKSSTLEAFRRLSGMQDVKDCFDEFISSPSHYHYLNKMEYSFSSIDHDLETNEERDEV